MAQKKRKTMIDAIKATRPRVHAPTQTHKDKRSHLISKAINKADKE